MIDTFHSGKAHLLKRSGGKARDKNDKRGSLMKAQLWRRQAVRVDLAEWPDRQFLKAQVTNILAKETQIFGNFWDYFWEIILM